MSTAFVLTGGGSLGAVQVGMLQALEEDGIRPDVVIGTSVGAVNAAFLAGPGTNAGRLRSLGALWSTLRRRHVFLPDLRRWVGATVRSAPSLFAPDPLRQLLETNLGYQGLAAARIPVHVVATDLLTGTAHVLSSGDVITAVLASTAVPGLLPPVQRDGRILVDGGIGPHESLAYADRIGVDDVYLLPAGYPCAPRSAPTTALGITLTAFNLLVHVQLLTEVAQYAGLARLHVLPPLCPLAVSPADFSHAHVLMSRAHDATAAWLDKSPMRGCLGEHLALHEPPSRGNARSARSATSITAPTLEATA